MKKTVQVRDVVIGEGLPKICVSIMGKTKEALIEEIHYIKELDIDVVEWRMDHYDKIDELQMVKETVNQIRSELGNIPLLATFRSKSEGGEKELNEEAYIKLNEEIIASEEVDLIDVELFLGDEPVKDLVEFAHTHNVKVVMSNHDFDQTPAKDEIVSRLCKMQDLNADLPKIAVMPQSIDDVLCLLCATNEMVTKYADRPIITMSMSGKGTISRIAGEIFGSALTFGAAKEASAPGQVEVNKLRNTLKIIHDAQ